MKVDLKVQYSQTDSRWSNVLLGFNTDKQYNFYNYACLLCCLASISQYYGKSIDPVQLNDLLKGLGVNVGYQAGTGNYVWKSLTKIYGDITEKLTFASANGPLTQEQINEIKSALDNRYPVIALIDSAPNTSPLDFHFVTITDYNSNDENDFTIYDPMGGATKSLRAYMGWFRPSARETIRQYIIYTGPRPQLELGTINIPIAVNESNVRGSSQWDRICEYLSLDPKHTLFEKVRDIIDELKKIKESAAIMSGQIGGLILEKKALVEKMNADLITYQKEMEALKLNMTSTKPDFEALQLEYDKRMHVLNNENEQLLLKVKELNTENESLKTQLTGSVTIPNMTPAELTQGKSFLRKIWDFFTKLTVDELKHVSP